jgi:N-acetylmuramoyl-L-alanine amidase
VRNKQDANDSPVDVQEVCTAYPCHHKIERMGSGSSYLCKTKVMSMLTIHDRPLPYVTKLPERAASTVTLVVIHCTELPDLAMAREYGEKVLYESGAGNSGHYYIDRDGSVYRYVPGTRVAHHVRGYNPPSIGIELVNRGRYPDWFDSRRQTMTEPYAEAQIASLPASDDPSKEVPRKLDPGPLFPWSEVLAGSGLTRVGTDHEGRPV